jgi:putative ABC transport system permease protein
MEAFWQDVRYGVRMLLKTRGLSAIIVLTLGLGIGANTAVFSVVNSFLLRPMPVEDPGRIAVVAISHPGNTDPHGVSYLDLQDFRKNSGAFTDLLAYDLGFVGLSDGGRATRLTVSYVTGNFFSVLGVNPALGRLILPSEGQVSGADPILVLGNGFWRNHYGSDPSVVGRNVKVNGHAFTIVGVVPESFHGAYALAEMDAYLPITMASLEGGNEDFLQRRESHRLHVMGRLKHGVSFLQAQAALQVVANQLSAEYPVTDKDLRAHVFPEPLARPEPDSAQQNPIVAAIFLALVSLVLLLACVNVANILLVRATSRQKELAIRCTLGAGRTRLLRQLLTESVILALLGGAAGALIGRWCSHLLGSIRFAADLPIRFDFSFDWRVFAYVAAIALFAGIAVGLVPALRASKANPNDALRESGRSNSGGAGRHRLRNILVASQVAGSLIVIVAASLFVRSLQNAESVNLGFRPENVVNFTMDPGQIGYDQAHTKTFYRQLEDRVRSLPGIQSTSFAYSLPLGYYNNGGSVVAEGQVLQPGDRGVSAGYNSVGPGYFRTMRIPLLRGRTFTDADTETSRRVAVVNERFAKLLWPNQDPIGKRFSYKGEKGPFVEVVGVTRDGKYQFIFEDPIAYFFLPLSQEFKTLHVLQVKTIGPPESVATAVRNEIRNFDPDLPIFDVGTMERSLQGGNGFFLLRVGAQFAAALGALGLLLAVVGVYGVVSYSAGQRTHEIGIRMALGAQRGNILKMIVSQGLGVVLVGLGVGLLAALALTRPLANFLFGIKTYDPVTYVSAIMLLAGAALAACYIPARRSTRVDPTVALRYE